MQKWNPIWWFGNADEPTPPDWYRPNEKLRTCEWHFRNPLHNFTFYVIGIADKDFDCVGKYPKEVFNPNDGWNRTVCRYKCLRLPFVSYKKGRFQFYCGWRDRGNFGFKLRCHKEPPKKEEPKEPVVNR